MEWNDIDVDSLGEDAVGEGKVSCRMGMGNGLAS